MRKLYPDDLIHCPAFCFAQYDGAGESVQNQNSGYRSKGAMLQDYVFLLTSSEAMIRLMTKRAAQSITL